MTFDRLKWAASTGLDLSPGDPVAAWAVTEIERLRAALSEIRDYCRAFKESSFTGEAELERIAVKALADRI